MTWHDYSVSFAEFADDLTDKLVAEGWVREEAGYNTVQPAGYSSIRLLIKLAYSLNMYRGDGLSTGTYDMTYIEAALRAGYSEATHAPTGNGGLTRFRLIESATDYSASESAYLYVKGWITDKICAIQIRCDPLISGGGNYQFIFVGECLAIDAAANTVLLLAPEYYSETGTLSSAQSYFPSEGETHFIHCLGDGNAYYPVGFGMCASRLSNKVRSTPLYVWMRLGIGTLEVTSLMWQIPEVRITLWSNGIELLDDTFTEGSETYQRMWPMSQGNNTLGQVCMSKASSTAKLGYSAVYPWLRKV